MSTSEFLESALSVAVRARMAAAALAPMLTQRWFEAPRFIKPQVHLGCGLSESLVRGLAIEMGGRWSECLSDRGTVIYALEAEAHGVEVVGQGSRDATTSDLERLRDQRIAYHREAPLPTLTTRTDWPRDSEGGKL